MISARCAAGSPYKQAPQPAPGVYEQPILSCSRPRGWAFEAQNTDAGRILGRREPRFIPKQTHNSNDQLRTRGFFVVSSRAKAGIEAPVTTSPARQKTPPRYRPP